MELKMRGQRPGIAPLWCPGRRSAHPCSKDGLPASETSRGGTLVGNGRRRMTTESLRGQEPRLSEAVIELRSLILNRWPSATFEIAHADDPGGLYLTPVVDVEDTEEVFDLVVDRLLGLGLLPVPPERQVQAPNVGRDEDRREDDQRPRGDPNRSIS